MLVIIIIIDIQALIFDTLFCNCIYSLPTASLACCYCACRFIIIIIAFVVIVVALVIAVLFLPQHNLLQL